MQFFTCRQHADEGVGLFILRLRECLSRWRAKEAGTAEPDSEMLKSQLVLGLRPGPVQIELPRLLRREPRLSFEDLCKEAKAVEQEHRTLAEEPTMCQAVIAPLSTRPLPQETLLANWQEMRDSLRAEILKEMSSQLSDMKEALLTEMRTQRECRPPRRLGVPSTKCPVTLSLISHGDRDALRRPYSGMSRGVQSASSVGGPAMSGETVPTAAPTIRIFDLLDCQRAGG